MTTKHQTDSFGRHSYKNYHIEPMHSTWSIYNHFNSMYDCKDGFKTVEEAVEWIDRWRA